MMAWCKIVQARLSVIQSKRKAMKQDEILFALAAEEVVNKTSNLEAQITGLLEQKER